MKSLKLLSVAAGVAALLLFAPGAHAQSVTGKWNIEYDSKMSMSGGGGGAVVEERSKARLTLEQHGDSITGAWFSLAPPPPGKPAAQPRPIRGTVSGKTVRFSSGPTDATINRNGEESTMKVMTDFEATIDGDKVAGTMTSHPIDGGMAGLTRKFDGTRDKS